MHIYEGADITLYSRCGMNNQKIGHLSSQLVHCSWGRN